MKKRVLFMFCIVVMFCCMAGTVTAAEATENVLEEGAPLAELLEQTTPEVPTTIYPAEVRASEEDGVVRLEKIYYLTTKDNPASIPTNDFEREGRIYTLLDILKNDQTEIDTKDHIEIITQDSKTKDMAEIIKTLEPELEISTEDGYVGRLLLDYTTIAVEATDYKTSSRTVSAARTYPNLSDADISLIPKSVEEGGRMLSLADVDWQSAATDNLDGYDVALRYNAVATYTGTATSKYATGYTVTAEYKGDITKTSGDTIVYTAIFSSMDTVEVPVEDIGNTTEVNWPLILIPVGALTLGAAGYGGKKWYTHYVNKKRGYE